MINIVGIIIAASGFFAPYLTDGRIPSTALFWIGGLVFLNKGILIKPETTWTKWARIGIWTNIALFLIMLSTFYLSVGRSMSPMVGQLSRVPYWLARPATALGQQIFPFPETHYPDGSVSFHTLRGIIPICSFCMKIRDDKGYWDQVEVYVKEHTEANFSHGICPECAEKHYGKYLRPPKNA